MDLFVAQAIFAIFYKNQLDAAFGAADYAADNNMPEWQRRFLALDISEGSAMYARHFLFDRWFIKFVSAPSMPEKLAVAKQAGEDGIEYLMTRFLKGSSSWWICKIAGGWNDWEKLGMYKVRYSFDLPCNGWKYNYTPEQVDWLQELNKVLFGLNYNSHGRLLAKLIKKGLEDGKWWKTTNDQFVWFGTINPKEWWK